MLQNKREIKFRAWDTQQENMWDWSYLIDKQCTYLNSHYFIAMQFTGLHDKNGKEIYEGDVLKCAFAFGDNICEVVEENGCFWVSQKNRKIEDKAHDNLYWHAEGSEVIGNIYENKELYVTE